MGSSSKLVERLQPCQPNANNSAIERRHSPWTLPGLQSRLLLSSEGPRDVEFWYLGRGMAAAGAACRLAICERGGRVVAFGTFKPERSFLFAWDFSQQKAFF